MAIMDSGCCYALAGETRKWAGACDWLTVNANLTFFFFCQNIFLFSAPSDIQVHIKATCKDLDSRQIWRTCCVKRTVTFNQTVQTFRWNWSLHGSFFTTLYTFLCLYCFNVLQPLWCSFGAWAPIIAARCSDFLIAVTFSVVHSSDLHDFFFFSMFNINHALKHTTAKLFSLMGIFFNKK